MSVGLTNGGFIFFAEAGSRVGLNRLPLANTFEVDGSASKAAAGGWLANSDARIKEQVHTVDRALETLGRVRLVKFRYSPEYRAAHPQLADREYLNVIAQEFREVFPEHVMGSGERLPSGDEILQVDPYPLTIYAAAAVQELHAVVQVQAETIARLEKRLDELEGRAASADRQGAALGIERGVAGHALADRR